ncbi:MAG TPA: nucleotidyl transferase AbiEii/AbiGii toxin family protein, partial [Cyclobacteriaceae bacterium]|nr:nucleotidyl transferase AbiEii/AbiGii toxin family protein [Cyclobacteriaceae bacterium]
MTGTRIQDWINQSPDRVAFRQAVHTILVAITRSVTLKTNMVMKGGILLALGYESTRYTKDIDFSTEKTLKEFDIELFISELRSALIEAVEQLNYGLDCRIQSFKQKPPKSDATFPTIEISVGYAYKHNRNAHRRLLKNNSSEIVEIDYSLNEPSRDIEILEIDEGTQLRIYGFTELVAEKYRAILQQVSRNRRRRQDVYDLNFLLAHHPQAMDDATKQKILESLVEKSQSRGLTVTKSSLSDPEVIRLSREEYDLLASEIEEPLPDFDRLYSVIRDYYESLPW